MPVCYCKNSGGYGRFIPVVEQQPVKPKVEENGWCTETNAFLPTTPDSWDKLIDDLRNAAEGDIVACAYLSPEGEGCTKCQANATRECTRIAFTDILSRIERLRRASDD